MNDIYLNINSLHKKLERLIEKHIELKNQYTHLLSEKEELEVEISRLKVEKEESEHHIQQQNPKPESENQKVLVKARINELVKEIDKCISMLS